MDLLVGVQLVQDFIVILQVKHACVMQQHRFGVVHRVHYTKHTFKRVSILLIASQIKI